MLQCLKQAPLIRPSGTFSHEGRRITGDIAPNPPHPRCHPGLEPGSILRRRHRHNLRIGPGSRPGRQPATLANQAFRTANTPIPAVPPDPPHPRCHPGLEPGSIPRLRHLRNLRIGPGSRPGRQPATSANQAFRTANTPKPAVPPRPAPPPMSFRRRPESISASLPALQAHGSAPKPPAPTQKTYPPAPSPPLSFSRRYLRRGHDE